MKLHVAELSRYTKEKKAVTIIMPAEKIKNIFDVPLKVRVYNRKNAIGYYTMAVYIVWKDGMKTKNFEELQISFSWNTHQNLPSCKK